MIGSTDSASVIPRPSDIYARWIEPKINKYSEPLTTFKRKPTIIPTDMKKCQEIMEGLRLLIVVKEEQIQRLKLGGATDTMSGKELNLTDKTILPPWVIEKFDYLEDNYKQLEDKYKRLEQVNRYLKQTQLAQSKALIETPSKDHVDQMNKGHIEELRYTKRKRNDLLAENGKLNMQNIKLHDQNTHLID